MANKARYYGLATQSETKDVLRKDRAARIYPETFGYTAVLAAVLNYKDAHANFDELSSTLAAERIASELNRTKLYGTITSESSRISGNGYSVALTKGKDLITISKASER